MSLPGGKQVTFNGSAVYIKRSVSAFHGLYYSTFQALVQQFRTYAETSLCVEGGLHVVAPPEMFTQGCQPSPQGDPCGRAGGGWGNFLCLL